MKKNVFKSSLVGCTLAFAAVAGVAHANETEILGKSVEHEFITKRIVTLSGEINDNKAREIIAKLRYLDDNNPENKDIELDIDSQGGWVVSGLAIYDFIQSMKSDVKTVCRGQASSMAAVLLSAGAPGKRMATPNCRIMIHQVRGSPGSATATDLQIAVSEASLLKEKLYTIMSEHSGLSENQLRRLAARDMYLSPPEAQLLGLIDEITASKQVHAQPGPRIIPDSVRQRLPD